MSFIGCTEQYQFCQHTDCNNLTGLYASKKAKDSVTKTEVQSALSDLLWKAIWGTNMEFLYIFLGADVLRANERLYRLGFLSSAPENNHWQLEMENIHNVSMSLLQRRFIDFADPPALEIRPNATVRDYLQPPGDQERFCNAMKIRSPGNTSFNVAALLALCLTCIVVVLISLLLPVVTSRLPMRRRSAIGRSTSTRTAMWEEQGILQLLEDVLRLRRTLESRDIRSVNSTDNDISVQETNEQAFPLRTLNPRVSDLPLRHRAEAQHRWSY